MDTEEKSRPQPALGSLIRLELGLARRDTWFTAAWAAACGCVASGGLAWRQETALTLALALFLADPLMGAVCAALRRFPSSARDTSSNPGHRAVAATDALKPPTALFPPRLLPVLLQWLHRVLTWPRTLVIPPVFPALIAVTVGLVAALVIAVVLGPGVTLIVAFGLGLAILRFIAFGQRSVERIWQRALLEVGLAWLIGFVALYDVYTFPRGGFYGGQTWWEWRLWEQYGWEPLAIAALYAVAYAAWLGLRSRRWLDARLWLLNLAQVAVVGLLAVERRPLLAAATALLLLGQMLFQPWLRMGQGPTWYWRGTQLLLMISLLVASAALTNLGLGW